MTAENARRSDSSRELDEHPRSAQSVREPAAVYRSEAALAATG
jgi:hypothetical protein